MVMLATLMVMLATKDTELAEMWPQSCWQVGLGLLLIAMLVGPDEHNLHHRH